ncbi:DUF2237 domain-containing protein [Candidatus Sulfurimonas marisnigri]|uniref:DUF2237 domain-containing protein n=1 Tax=Candidatus Sulfurimonas marisnigri TaxID=2740405 RepID=A0A7S7LZC5_9BACT|nr:DUF2237 domain-containing protein [Candidatus Sulfurimonas marisnigri]QOY54219.1 DUF2237 domain-containing protein [Candidatus Sulfurimonas marisnigri]
MPKTQFVFEEVNVLGEFLEPCSLDPLTGFKRNGTCQVTPDNQGMHAVCIYASKEFLEYSKRTGNDLSTPMPQYNFPGVKPGQSWCLSGLRFAQAVKDGNAPQIFIHATHQAILQLVDLETLKKLAIDL